MTNVNVNFKNVTILSPVYNERETIIIFLIEIQKVITTLVSNFNVKTYLINDGSVDGTFDLDFSDFKNLGISVINLERNYGHQSALQSGIDYAKDSDYIVVLDSDLQDPPSYISEIIQELEDGFEIVMTKRVNRFDKKSKKIFAFIYYRYLKYFFQRNIVLDSGDYWGINKSVTQKMLVTSLEKNIYFRGYLPNLSNKLSVVNISRNQRVAGISKYGITSMLKLGYMGILNSSPNKVHVYFKYLLSIFLFSLGPVLLYMILWDILNYSGEILTKYIVAIYLILMAIFGIGLPIFLGRIKQQVILAKIRNVESLA
jgi:dolichol-phosphate mannosyltransferase